MKNRRRYWMILICKISNKTNINWFQVGAVILVQECKRHNQNVPTLIDSYVHLFSCFSRLWTAFILWEGSTYNTLSPPPHLLPSSRHGTFVTLYRPGVAHATCPSIPNKFRPISTRKNPISPQYWPHELRTIQCLVCVTSSYPHPTIETPWLWPVFSKEGSVMIPPG